MAASNCPGPGNHFLVTVTVDGTTYTWAEVDNSAGVNTVAVAFPSFNYATASTAVAAAASTTAHTVSVNVVAVAHVAHPDNAVTVGPLLSKVHFDHA